MQPSSQFDALEITDHTVWSGRVECTLTVDEPAIERAYRVVADYDIEEEDFSDVRVLGVWANDLDERPLADAALSKAIARYLDAADVDWLHERLYRLHSEHWDDVRAYDWADSRGFV
jgi:hypothetical protein